MTLQTERLCTADQIRAFLNGNETVDYHPQDRACAYEFVRRRLVRIGYDRLRRPDKGAVHKYLAKTTGLSRAQVTRLIAQYRETGQVADHRQRNSGRPFEQVCTAADIRLLAEVDQIGNQMCGPATCAVMRRQFEIFGERRFEVTVRSCWYGAVLRACQMAIDADLNGVIANVRNGVGHWKRMATLLARTLAEPQARSGTGRTERRAAATSGPKYRHDRTVTF